MRKIVYSMQFKGTASRAGEEAGVLKATTSAASGAIRTVVSPDGVVSEFVPAEGGVAFFESEVRMTAAEHFQESGTITFGEGDHTLRFDTEGTGVLRPTADHHEMMGAVVWKVTGGEGQFQNAKGFITSNFQVSDHGEVTDYHFGVILIE
jgi:hypothetical protein